MRTSYRTTLTIFIDILHFTWLYNNAQLDLIMCKMEVQCSAISKYALFSDITLCRVPKVELVGVIIYPIGLKHFFKKDFFIK